VDTGKVEGAAPAVDGRPPWQCPAAPFAPLLRRSGCFSLGHTSETRLRRRRRMKVLAAPADAAARRRVKCDACLRRHDEAQGCDACGSRVRVNTKASRARPRYSFLTACPPNSLRSDASSLSANESLSRERKRSISDSVITGAETLSSSAAFTVQRPSPESTT